MKTFDLKTFNQHGNEFVNLSWSFDKVNGIVISEKITQVRKVGGVVPANGCDFVSHLGSCDSDNFFENNSNLSINNLFFRADYNYKINGFMYCLPENKSVAIANIEQQVNAFLTREIVLMESDIIKLRKHLK